MAYFQWFVRTVCNGKHGYLKGACNVLLAYRALTLPRMEKPVKNMKDKLSETL